MRATKRATEIRQGEIVRAALSLIGREGIRGLRIVSLARKVGIVPSGIYRHYRNKDEVLDAILDAIQQQLSANVRAVARGDADALTRLRALLMKHAGLIRGNKAIPTVMFSAEVYTGSPRRRVRLLHILEGYLADVAALVEQGQREGTIRTELNAHAVAITFLGLIQPAAILRHLSAGRYDVTRQAEAAWPLFRRAIRREDHPDGTAPADPRNRQPKEVKVNSHGEPQ